MIAWVILSNGRNMREENGLQHLQPVCLWLENRELAEMVLVERAPLVVSAAQHACHH